MNFSFNFDEFCVFSTNVYSPVPVLKSFSGNYNLGDLAAWQGNHAKAQRR
jgi:hypothetical protein